MFQLDCLAIEPKGFSCLLLAPPLCWYWGYGHMPSYIALFYRSAEDSNSGSYTCTEIRFRAEPSPWFLPLHSFPSVLYGPSSQVWLYLVDCQPRSAEAATNNGKCHSVRTGSYSLESNEDGFQEPKSSDPPVLCIKWLSMCRPPCTCSYVSSSELM